MSTIRDKFFADKAQGALWDVAVSIKRGNPLPLDSNSVFASYADLETYAAGVLAYPGQIVTVVNTDSTGIYYLDQDLAINEVGKIPSADDKSIEIADGAIAMHDFGTSFYKFVPEEKNEETGEVTKAAEYVKVEVSEENPWKAGLEPRVVSENGELVIGWFEPNPTTIEGVQDQVTGVQGTVNDLDEIINKEGGLVDQVEDLQEEIGHAATETGDAATGLYAELDKKADSENVYTKAETDNLLLNKANATDVYTKTETDSAISAAVANASHLKRKIVENVEAIEAYIQNNSDAELYVFMVPTVYNYTTESNKYDEYIVLKNADESYSIEPVGSWAVDLADYVSETELTQYLTQYYTSAKVDEILDAYSTTAEIETELEKYYTIEQLTTLLEGYYTEEELDGILADVYNKSDIDTKFEDYYNKESIDASLGNKVDKVDGKSLVADTEIEKLSTVQANAEPNFIKSVTNRFTVSDGQLSLNPLKVEDIDGMEAALERKLDRVYYTVPAVDENGDPIYEDDGITQATVQVEGALLSPEDKEKLDSLVIGDNGVEISGKVNAANVEGLATWVTQNRDTVPGLFTTTEAKKLEDIEAGAQKNFIQSANTAQFNVDENGYLTLVNDPGIKSVSSDFTISEAGELQLSTSYVTTAIYAAEVGNLAELLRVSGIENSTLVDEINSINERLKWQDMTE